MPDMDLSNAKQMTDQAYVVYGLPDDRMVELKSIASNGVPNLGIPGCVSIFPHLDAGVRGRFGTTMVGPGVVPRLPTSTHPPLLVNTLADADICRKSLHALGAFVDASGAACFNHPRAVLGSSRDNVSVALRTVDGMHVPLTVRVALDDPSALEPAMEEAGLTYPVIVRIAGAHGGTSTRKIDSAAAIRPALKTIPWGGRELYVTQYVPYRSNDGLHRKQRLVVIGREVFLRHVIATADWHVHAQDRDPDTAREEREAIANFESGLLPRIRPIVLAAADALGLDYFGIDCANTDDGGLLVFEANASMNNLLNTEPLPNCWQEPIEGIKAALQELLIAPNYWRHPPRGERA